MTTIADKELEALLTLCPAERVTKEYIDSRIKDTTFAKMEDTTTICRITLDNGYTVNGFSACVNPENYNKEIGEKIAYDNAYRELWPLFGFILAEKNKLRKEATND